MERWQIWQIAFIAATFTDFDLLANSADRCFSAYNHLNNYYVIKAELIKEELLFNPLVNIFATTMVSALHLRDGCTEVICKW